MAWTLTGLVMLVVTGLVAAHALSDPAAFRPQFAEDGLVTNELTQRHADQPGVRWSKDWSVTSGSLFAVAGMGWSGRPDGVLPDAQSSRSTDSAVFRAVSRRGDFGDVRVRLALRVRRLVSTERTPKRDYDGVHLLVRYRSPQQLYAVSLQRRDGRLSIKRKDPGGPSNGGRYTTLVEAPFPLGNEWVEVDVRVWDTDDGGTRLELRIEGRVIAVAVDRSAQRIVRAGAVGLRADNAEFFFKNFAAEPVEAN